MDIEIYEPFRKLLDPLSREEKEQLERNLVLDGCRDPLVVWEVDGKTILIDGHNRYEICQRLAIPFEVFPKQFESEDEAADWIDANQEGRRNSNPMQLSVIRGRRYNRAKKKIPNASGNNQHKEVEGQNVPQPSTAETLAESYGVDARTIKRDGKFAEAVEALGLEAEIGGGEVNATKTAVIEAAKPIIEAEREHKRWKEEVAKSPLAPPPEPPKPTLEDIQKARAHVSYNSGENEWYTPPEFIKATIDVMGGIDLDPASSEIANRTVNAASFFTKDDDGLSKVWSGRVWCNPPYAQPLIANFAEAIASKYESKEIEQAIVLVNNATETAWFQRMLSVADAICLPRGRIRFLDPQGNPGAPLQGQAILYFGKSTEAFKDSFSQFGRVLNG